jgi:hypothetical protein
MHICPLVYVNQVGTDEYLLYKSRTLLPATQMMAESNGGGSVSGVGLKPHTTVTVTTDPTLAQSLEIR